MTNLVYLKREGHAVTNPDLISVVNNSANNTHACFREPHLFSLMVLRNTKT